MRRMRAKGMKLAKIADVFDCSEAHVSSVVSGRIGANDKDDPPKPEIRVNAMPWITKAQLTAGRAR